MFAVITTGGKQYKVAKDNILKIEKINGEAGSRIEFNEILMVSDHTNAISIGKPLLKNARVTAEVLQQMKDDKIIVFKKKRRQNYRRKHGHRQELTEIKILDITK